MNDLEIAIQQEVLWKVMQLRLSGEAKSISEACEMAEVPLSTYYSWHKLHPDTAIIFKEMHSLELRMAIDTALGSRLGLLRRAIELGLSSTNPEEVMKVFQFVSEFLSSLSYTSEKPNEEKETKETVTPAQDFLARNNMPVLRKASNKIGGVRLSVEENGLDMEFYKERDVIDISANSLAEDDERTG